MKSSRLHWVDVLFFVLVVATAGGLRAGYLLTCIDDLHELPFQVQDEQTAIDLMPGSGRTSERQPLVDNIRAYNWYASRAPLAELEEGTAHVAPAYPWLVANVARIFSDGKDVTWTLRIGQCVLGALTAGWYFWFARLAFVSSFVGLLAGLLTAIHPFWIVNVVELQDGTLTCFLLASCLVLGTAGAKRGGPLLSLLFGVSLAALALTRAALLPFAFVACLWYLLRCRGLPRGWVCALLAFLGFANGLAPWTVRNFQVFGDIVPITDTAYLHLWIGNNELAHGGPQDANILRESLPPERYKALAAEPNQARRYAMLAEDSRAAARDNPTGIVDKRLRSGIAFLFGAAWSRNHTLVRETVNDPPNLPLDLAEVLPLALRISLLSSLVLGLLGWRWSYGWNREANLASLALLWVPLPYVLSHAEHFSGPRLPLDGVLLCFTAFALAWMFPPVARVVFDESDVE